ncbi:MAG: hypothetical protein KKD73_05250 [Proteobacteria bacterium]|nr:hypothetical protein [Pseudomonadota bacterium]MBU1641604.1 hypothetical protein [Pseudomonadota bacterium]
MKPKMTIIKTMAVLFTLGLGFSGCFSTNSEKMMDDSMEKGSMSTPMESMKDDTMHDNTMGTMKDGAMMETMPAPMDTMEKDSMGSGMADDSMK